MKDLKVSSFKATIKYKPVYTCASCSTRASGDTKILGISGHDLSTISLTIRQERLESHYMPVGWARSYDTGFQCPKCVNK